MGYPSFEEYTDALRLPPGAVFQDPVLAAGSVRKSAAGVPFARSGNFALTYEVSVNGARYAVRCFHKEADSLERRYDAIARKLKSIASPYFIEFDFLPGGIRTESGQFPIVRMKWADGRSLAQFISEHRDDPLRCGSCAIRCATSRGTWSRTISGTATSSRATSSFAAPPI